MSYYAGYLKELEFKGIINICPHCERPYKIGVNGIVLGCDECLKVTRNPIDGTVLELDGVDVDEEEKV